MPLTKVKAGSNMYQGWVTHTHTHLGGVCPHDCKYCYVQAMERRFKHGRYVGELKLIEKEFKAQYGEGKTIFMEHCNDLFAKAVPEEWIRSVLDHCKQWPENEYVFQTKNPARYDQFLSRMPPRRLLGCTIETMNAGVASAVSKAPIPLRRANAMRKLSEAGERTFITVEPILRGSPGLLANVIASIKPDFVNIGADSKGSGLDEPSGADVRTLIKLINKRGIEIRAKSNLGRLIDG